MQNGVINFSRNNLTWRGLLSRHVVHVIKTQTKCAKLLFTIRICFLIIHATLFELLLRDVSFAFYSDFDEIIFWNRNPGSFIHGRTKALHFNSFVFFGWVCCCVSSCLHLPKNRDCENLRILEVFNELSNPFTCRFRFGPICCSYLWIEFTRMTGKGNTKKKL